jgi:hypothetical protein
LIALFTIDKKQTLKQHCKAITITQPDLASFILKAMSGQLPWGHRAHHREFMPEHLSLTEDDRLAMVTSGVGRVTGKAGKAFNKITAMFEERRLLSGHIFFNPDQTDWHFFYFDQRDFAERGNH